jgi:uncharacterized protein
MPHPEIGLIFFFIAFIYASVGFGGGSSYLAVLALYALPFQEMRLIALICNIIVVTGGTIIFIRNGQVNFKKILPLVIASVPMAFVGASLAISQQAFFVILGIALIIAAVLLWITTRPVSSNDTKKTGQATPVRNGVLGGCIGFLSGMVGIGGGIFLSPLLNLLHWDTPKKIAATASIFILVNSLAGIAGQLYHLPTAVNYLQVGILAGAVLVGGQMGSRMGAVKFNQTVVRRVTAVVVFAAGIEVLYKHLLK